MVTAIQPRSGRRTQCWRWLCLLLLGAIAEAQVCQTAGDMGATARTALEGAAKRYFEMAARGDTAGLRQNSIPSVAAGFAGIEAAVKENQAAFSGAQTAVRPPFLLTADGAQPVSPGLSSCAEYLE